MHTPFILTVDNSNIILRCDQLISNNDIQCNIYCDSEVIKKIFKIDYNSTISIGSYATAARSKNMYTVSDLQYILQEIDGKEYCKFEYTIQRGLIGKIVDRSQELYIYIIIKDGWIKVPIHDGIEFIISPKLYAQLSSSECCIANHITKIFGQLYDKNVEGKNRYTAFKLLSAFQQYIDKKIKYDKYVDIIRCYDTDDNRLNKYLLDTKMTGLSNFCMSSMCNLYMGMKDEILRSCIYDIALFLTNNEQLAKNIYDDPSIMVYKNVKYNMSKLTINTTKLINIYINVGKQYNNNIFKIIDTLNSLAKYLNN